MTDTPTIGLLMRDQESGTNNNLWGEYTDSNLAILDRKLTAVQSVTVSASVNVTYLDYSETNTYFAANVRFTGPSGDGTLTAAATLTFPNVRGDFKFENQTGQTLTYKTASGASITQPTGTRIMCKSDGTDFSYVSPTNVGPFTPTQTYDVTTKTYVDAAIAAATTSTSPGTVRITAADTTAKFLDGAIVEGDGITTTVLNPSGNETLSVAVTSIMHLEEFLALAGKVTAEIASGTTAMTANRRYRITGAGTATLPTFTAGQWNIVEYGADDGSTMTVGRNSQTIDGAPEDDTSARYGDVVMYCCTTAGAVVTKQIALLPS